MNIILKKFSKTRGSHAFLRFFVFFFKRHSAYSIFYASQRSFHQTFCRDLDSSISTSALPFQVCLPPLLLVIHHSEVSLEFSATPLR